jgi:hypothetical protein
VWLRCQGGFASQDAIEGRSADAELAGGSELVAAIEFEDELNMAMNDGIECHVIRGLGKGMGSRRGWRSGFEVGLKIEIQVRRTDDAGRRVQDRGFEDRSEFTNIARPCVLKKTGQSALGKHCSWLLIAAADAIDKRLGDGGDVFAVFAQWGYRKPDGGQAEGEVGQELALTGELALRCVRRDHE